MPALQLPTDLTPERLGDRQTLLDALDQAESRADGPRRRRHIDDYRGRAFAMLTSPAPRRRSTCRKRTGALADRYGRTRFGQSCLLARRLVEHGVPFVQVNWSDHVEAEEDSGDGGWDHHYRNFQIMQDRHAPWLDQSLSALLDRPARARLLERRWSSRSASSAATPKINDKAGRDHWPGCYQRLSPAAASAAAAPSARATPRPPSRPTRRSRPPT